MLSKDPVNMCITGVGGQGNVRASLILGRYFVKKGLFVTIGETYGVSQRGGSVISHLRISASIQYSPLVPEGMADLIVALEPLEGLRVLNQFGQPKTVLLTNTRSVYPMSVLSGETTYPDVDEVLSIAKKFSGQVYTIAATEIALELGDAMAANVIMLGALSGLNVLPVDALSLLEVLKYSLAGKHRQLNEEAFGLGAKSVQIYD